MILIKNLALSLVKLSLLFFIISFEKVIGLPMIFTTLLLIFFVNENSFYKYIYLVFGSMFLAVTYGISFSFSLLMLTGLVLAVSYGGNVIASDINRVLFLVYSSIMLIASASEVIWGRKMVGYFIVSSLIMIFILMKTLFFKYGLTGKITGKKSNFFR